MRARVLTPSLAGVLLVSCIPSEVFVVVSLTLFLPICLEQFARDNGYLLPDKTRLCSTAKTAPLNDADAAEDTRCVVKIGWIWVDSASFRYVCFSSQEGSH